MKYKEFLDWCNLRASDGCWSMGTAIFCSRIISNINALPFWKREKEWQKIRDDVERDVVSVIDEKIKQMIEKEATP